MEDEGLDPDVPPCILLVSAVLAMEPTDSLISLARVCGGGSVTERVQRFIWDHCVTKAARKGYAPHLKNFLKKLITEVESNGGIVLDQLYEQYAHYMTSLKDNNLIKANERVCKCISFLFPDGCLELASCPKSRKLVVPLQCSLNMLEGDTGCSVWPSGLFLSEFILSVPDIFSGRSCFEVGSGVGLVGICLAHVKASKVILSDGDLSTLANMKLNLELNQLSTETDVPERDSNMVECIYMPWESASESEVYDFEPDVVLGADIIYDPLCLPHLVRVLGILLNKMKSYPQKHKDSCQSSLPDGECVDGKVNVANQGKLHDNDLDKSDSDGDKNGCGFDACQVRAIQNGAPTAIPWRGPVAYIASVIRNIDTFNYFLALADKANLTVIDITETLKPFNLLPYRRSYDRSSIRLFIVSRK